MGTFLSALPRAFAERLTGRSRGRLRAHAGDASLGRRLATEDLAALRARLERLEPPGAVPGGTAGLVREAAEACSEAQRLLQAPGQTVSPAVEVLARGWQALALAEAGEGAVDELPRRPPCFFDPRHGMARFESLWTSPRHGTRTVPVCRADDVRLEEGIAPDLRTVEVEGRRVPWFEAGDPVRGYLDAVRLEEGIEPGVRKVEVGGRRTPYYDAGESVRSYLEGYFPSAAMEWARTSLVNRAHIPEGPRIRMGGAGGGPSGDGAAGGGIG